METLTLHINGMTCKHCVAGVTRALQGTESVAIEQVEIGSARVQFDAARTSRDAIAQAVLDEGYAVRSME